MSARLRSLWDMLQANAEKFVRASHYMATMQEVATRIVQGDKSHAQNDTNPMWVLERDANMGRLKGEMDDLRIQCEALGLTSSADHIKRFLPFPSFSPG